MAEDRPLAGWCAEHECIAEVYADGSIQCMFATIVESSFAKCRGIPIPKDELLRDRRRTARTGGNGS